jgi:hypothetical protein
MSDKLLEVMEKYKQTDTLTSPTSESVTSTDQYSPLQTVMKGLINRVVPGPVLGVVKRFMPDLSKFIEQIDDPDLLHELISEVYIRLKVVLDADHEAGYGGPDRCKCAGDAESIASIFGGDDGNREVDSTGSNDEGVPASISGPDSRREDSDSGHEAEIQSGV